MYRLLIDDEVALRQTLTNNEDNNTVQWEQLRNK
jgi:hypothetical protein